MDAHTAFKGTMWFNPENQGKVAVNLLMDAIENGKDLPENTYSSPELVNMGNFRLRYKGRLCK